MVRAQGATDASTAAMDMHSIPLRGHVFAKLVGKRAASIRLTEKRRESMEKDNAYLSNGGERMTWSQIRAHAEACDGKHSSGESLAPGCERAIELLCDDVGGRSRLQWYVIAIQARYNPISDATVRRPLTASVAGLPCPTLTNSESPESEDNGKVTPVLDNGDRELQRIVSAHRYYGSETKRQDNVTIEESNDATLGSTSSPVPRNVLIAKVQAFLAIKNHRRVRIMSELRVQGDQSAEDEICLIRYYCRVGATSIDAVDRALNFVKPRWSVQEEEKGADGRPTAVDDELPSVADVAHIDTQPVSTIRGLLHVVRGDYELRGTKSFSHLNGGCETHWFYINRFKQPSRNMKYSTLDIHTAQNLPTTL
jgi:hypothetical protein